MASKEISEVPSTQVPDKEVASKNAEKPLKKRPKKESEPAYSPDSEEDSLDDENGESGFFDAVTKFSGLRPGHYYKIVRLSNYRNRRVVAVPVKGFEGTFKNFNNLVQQ